MQAQIVFLITLFNKQVNMKAIQLVALIVALLALASPVSAGYSFGVGDGLAIVLFLAIGVVGVCALLGWVARRRANS